jgi:hypothetical protein
MLDASQDISGFGHPGRIARFHRTRYAVVAHLIATLALILAIAISVAAVTMEIAEAGVLNSMPEVGDGVAFAAFPALTLITLGGGLLTFFTAAPVTPPTGDRRVLPDIAEDVSIGSYQR